MGGVSHYNLSGTGTAPFGALRLEIPLLIAVAEGSLGVFRPNENGVHRTYVIPEAQLQWQLLPVLVKPYIGIGGGWFRAVSGPDPRRNDFTLSAAAGIRVGIPLTGFGVRAEARVRGIGSSFGSSATELTLGVSW
ncbi:MAG: hypothetical protein JWM41_4711 [Gemmatimonadetes bacterium]|nr:hypothetical protein [Gemmatimonadota bacterium]